ncbi:MAG: hypothetical protein ACKPKO_30480, partial [Candidatus Fonsibacter sp.]
EASTYNCRSLSRTTRASLGMVTNTSWSSLNSGVFVKERGTSSTFLGLLTKQDVLDALQQQPYNTNKVRTMVGGGFLDNLRSGLGWIQSKLSAVRGVLEHVPHQYAQTGANVLNALGYGKGQRPIDNRLS